MAQIVTFGEAMVRLAPPPFLRIEQTSSLTMTVGGSELNVAADLARLELNTSWISVLPDDPLGRFIRNKAREQGVDTSGVVFTKEGRAGCYYVEYGSSPRASKVHYDRAHSAISLLAKKPDWEKALAEARWFHTSGITPALSPACAAETQKAIRAAKERGCLVSYDLNYRAKLWRPEEAQAVTKQYIGLVDCCVGNEEDFQKVLGIELDAKSAGFEHVDEDYYARLAAEVQRRHGFQHVGISLRESHSVLRNGWKGLLYAGGKAVVSPGHELELVDRVGGGDSFSAGLIYGLFTGKSQQEAVNFAAAFSALKHTIWGDINLVTLDETEAYLKSGGTRIER